MTRRGGRQLLAVAAAAVLAACQPGGIGAPGRVVQEFFQAVLHGDTAAAGALVTAERRATLDELLRVATRERQLRRVAIVRARQWAEHGAVCEVRRHFANGDSDLVRVDVTRESGDWKLASVAVSPSEGRGR